MTRATRYFSDHQLPGERRRLALMEQCYDPGTIRRLTAIGVTHGWSCLEVGAGGGSIARWLAQRVGQSGRVVATDLDTRFFENATAANLEVWRHDIAADPLPTEQFDLVHVRWVLDLLPDRERVVEKLIAALKPGGWLLDEEPDLFPATSGASQAYRTLVEAGTAVLRSAGVDSEWARTLPAVLAAAGLVDVEADAEVDLFRGGSVMAESRQLSFEQLREPALEAGVISEAELDRGLACLADPGSWLMDFATVAAWGRRP
ncbi:MAG: class I SAM-dependent methyltransferase [Egibacteraceae bacterium]